MDNCEICNQLFDIDTMIMLPGGGRYICQPCLARQDDLAYMRAHPMYHLDRETGTITVVEPLTNEQDHVSKQIAGFPPTR